MRALIRCTTIAESLASTRQALTREGIPNPLANAEEMLENLLSLSRAELYLNRNQTLSEPQQAQLKKWGDERFSGKPLQYLFGHTGFFGLDFQVEEGVFIPRPETERMVEIVLDEIAKSKWGDPKSKIQNLRFLDIGTGSGAIAVALAANLPLAHGVAVDCSQPALRLARRNAERNGLLSRIRFEKSDLFPSLGDAFDVIISNPPYIPTLEIPNLTWEVKGFEPRAALDGGDDGLRFHRAIIGRSGEFLRPGGLLALEVGRGQAQAVAGMLREVGYGGIAIEKDLAGIDRVVLGDRPATLDTAGNG